MNEVKKVNQSCFDETTENILHELEKTRTDFWNLDRQSANFLNTLIKINNSKNVLEIQRCGSFGNDTYGKSNFLCDAGKNFVCITPDKNVYPCIFFCQPGNEIGYYEDGNIYIDGEILEESYGREIIDEDKIGIADEPITLGDDEYFVLGDNRNNSEDSRSANIGPVELEDIIGKAWFRMKGKNIGMGLIK
mgnify:CR=1 FL=1